MLKQKNCTGAYVPVYIHTRIHNHNELYSPEFSSKNHEMFISLFIMIGLGPVGTKDSFMVFVVPDTEAILHL